MVLKLHNFQEGKRLSKYLYEVEKLHMTLKWQRQKQMEWIHFICVHLGSIGVWSVRKLDFYLFYFTETKIMCWGEYLPVYGKTWPQLSI